MGICCLRGQGPPGAGPAGEGSQVHGGSAVSRALDCGWSLVRRRAPSPAPEERTLGPLASEPGGAYSGWKWLFQGRIKTKRNLTPKHSDPEAVHFKIPQSNSVLVEHHISACLASVTSSLCILDSQLLQTVHSEGSRYCGLHSSTPALKPAPRCFSWVRDLNLHIVFEENNIMCMNHLFT